MIEGPSESRRDTGEFHGGSAPHPGTAIEQALDAALSRRGRLTFAEFQELVLFGPGGYYDSGSDLLGPSGDFYTSPELHPAFGGLVAEQAHAIWLALGQPDAFSIVEYGGGSGALARDLLIWAQAVRPAFAHTIQYRIVERSERLVRRQQATLASAGFVGPTVTWERRSALAPAPLCPAALIIAHELLDALPVHIVRAEGDTFVERYVSGRSGVLRFEDGEPSTPSLGEYLHATGVQLAHGGQAEINLLAPAWLNQVTAQPGARAVLVVDYGADADTMFGAARSRGTLRCYYRHTVNDRPFERLGMQDITADVDFDTLARVAQANGFHVWGPRRQHQVLQELGIQALSRRLGGASLPVDQLEANRRALRELTEPTGLGRVQWMLVTRALADFTPFQAAAAENTAHLPLLGPDQMHLPASESLDPLDDFNQLWHEYWSGTEREFDAAEDRSHG